MYTLFGKLLCVFARCRADGATDVTRPSTPLIFLPLRSYNHSLSPVGARTHLITLRIIRITTWTLALGSDYSEISLATTL